MTPTERLAAEIANLEARLQLASEKDFYQQAEIARLKARVADLEKDKERLDWLLFQGVCWRDCDLENPDEHWVVGPQTEWLYYRYDGDKCGRGRIDAAMKGPQ